MERYTVQVINVRGGGEVVHSEEIVDADRLRDALRQRYGVAAYDLVNYLTGGQSTATLKQVVRWTRV